MVAAESVCVCVRACVRVGEIKDMTWGNDAKFHLFIFFCEVALMGLSKFKNRACLMEKRAEGEREELKRAETGGVLCGRRMQFEIGQIAFFFFSLSTFSPSAAHEA